MIERVQSSDGTEIAFERGGSGRPLVVVNGALSVGTPVNTLGPFLEPHFTLVRYDRRGRAASGDSPEYRPELELDDLAAVVDAVTEAGVRPFVFGHSGGACLALEAAMRGLPIERLAVNEPPYLVDGSRPRPPADLLDDLRARIAAGDREGALRRFLIDDVGMPGSAVEGLAASPVWARQLDLAHTAVYDTALTGDLEMPVDRLSALRLPVLVTHGGATAPWLQTSARTLAATIPNARLAVLEGQPHSPRPDVLAPELIRFFLV